MKTQSALVRADSAVELNTEAAVYLDLAAVVYPWNSELDDSLRLDDACLLYTSKCLI